MAFREVSILEIREVLRLWLMGDGYRKIAHSSDLDRKTVRRTSPPFGSSTTPTT